MITLHFDLLSQYKYELFHIYFTWFHCTERYELNKLTFLPMFGFIAQFVEHRTGIAEVMGSNPVEALNFFRLLLSNCLKWKIYCDDHSSISPTTAVQIWIISYIFHTISLYGKIWTQWIDLAPNVWLHSSVGRASHRYRGCHGFESRWSPGFFFSGFFFPIGKFTAMITLHFHLLPKYKSTHWEQGQFIEFIFSRAVKWCEVCMK